MLTLFIKRLVRQFISRKNKIPVITSYTSNTALETVMSGWQGTPLDQNGRFINLDSPTILGFHNIVKHIFGRNSQREIKKKDKWRISVLKDDAWINDAEDKIVWLGHASFFIQIGGRRILTDPIFGKLPIVKRHSEMPIDANKLLGIDYILVSHAHYDHCDKKSLKLLAKNNPKSMILCGLKLDKLINNKWVSNPVQTAGWYQRYKIDNDLQITFVPARHWANRNLFDANTTLWGGFVNLL